MPANTSSRPRRQALGPCTLTVLLMLAACGGADTSEAEAGSLAEEQPGASGSILRLQVLSDQVSPPAPQVVAHYVPGDSDRPWRRSENNYHEVTESGGEKVVRIESDVPSNVGIEAPLDLTTFDRVDALVRIPEGEEELLRISLHRGVGRVLVSAILTVTGTGDWQTVDFPLPGIERQEGLITDVALQVAGESSWTEVRAIDVLRQRAAALLPAPGEEPALVDHGSDARRGWGLDPQMGAIWRLDEGLSKGDARLRFSYATGPSLRGAELVVEGLDEQARVLPLESAERRWERFDEALPRLAAGHEVHFFVRASTDERLGPTALAELHVEWPVLAPPGGDQDTETPHAPLVLLVTSDTHRGDHVSRGGTRGLVNTPRIDALGARGVQFTNAFAPSNMTNPSHVALMTGESPRDTRIVGNQSPLDDAAVTLAERFAAAGWATAAAVSVHHIYHPFSGLGQGFDRYDGPEPRTDFRNQRRPGHVAVERALEWIDERNDQPLFLWVHVFDVHGPYEAKADFVERYAGHTGGGVDANADPVPSGALPKWIMDSPEEMANVRGNHNRYRAAVDQVDELLGRLFVHPRATGSRGIVGLTADHGESFGRHELWWTHHGLYTDQLHVPLIVAGGGLPEGLQSDAPVEMVSLGSTLMELAGLDPTEHPAPTLDVTGERPSTPRFALGFSGEKAAIDHEGWLLILNLQHHKHDQGPREFRKGDVELYHVEDDPACERDLAGFENARVERLKGALIRWLNDARTEGYATVFNVSATAVKRLEAMGYSGMTESPNSGAWYVRDQ